MVLEHRYRAMSVVGTLLRAAEAVIIANYPTVQWLTTIVPVFKRLPAVMLVANELLFATPTGKNHG
jgi:hypothetical protein